MKKITAILGAVLISFAVSGIAKAEEDEVFKKGAKVFKKCKACHEIGEGASNKVGPQLTDIVGRKAAAVGEFAGYSDAIKAKAAEGLEWTEENLRSFLTKPKDFLPETAMNFSGLKKEKDLDGIIAYLKANGKAPE